jgi:hypothetical protein
MASVARDAWAALFAALQADTTLAGVRWLTPEDVDEDEVNQHWPTDASAVWIDRKTTRREPIAVRGGSGTRTWEVDLTLTIRTNDPTGVWSTAAALDEVVWGAILRAAPAVPGLFDVTQPTPMDWDQPGSVVLTLQEER